MAEQELIAVVGMAGRFPMAAGVDELWDNLVAGRECLQELDDEGLLARGETPERLRHPAYVRRRPLIDHMEDFDARFFGMTSKEAEVRDPQHRLFLETCHALLERAGHDPGQCMGSIGVYAGVNGTRYSDLHLRTHPDLVTAVGELAIETSTNVDYLTTFTAYKLGLRGPCLTVSTACSTSLVAIHLACQALRAGECEMAIAGGVEVEWPYGLGYVYAPGSIFPPDGHCRPFDAAAAGTVFGSGVGAVLLKRHADAVADRDTIYAVVRGSAVNNDGAEKVGFTAPGVNGQSACIGEALVSAGVDPASISYVEAHGTATRLGDPIEVTALAQAYRLAGGSLPPASCGIGSIKSNIGHLGPAAGVAGFVKTVLALHRERIPPTINFTRPNPALHLEDTPFRVVSELEEWPRVEGRPRRAGVSSFGIGGTNAHVIVEEAPAAPVPPGNDGRPHLLLWSAKTEAAAAQVRDGLAAHLEAADGGLRDVAHTLRVGRAGHRVRGAVVACDPGQAAEALRQAEVGPADGPPPLVLAFPGQGAQRIRMAHGLYELDETFRRGCDACFEVLPDGDGLRSAWLEGPAERLAETAVAQPLLYLVEYVLASVLVSIAGRPAAVLGHSLGELVAGAVAGVFSFEDGLRAVAERARLMQEMPRGSMLAVPAAPPDVRRLLPPGVAIAAVNARRQVVVSGAPDRVAEAEERFREAGIKSQALATSHAYHSPLMAPASERFRAFLDTLELARPRIPLLSAATAAFEDEAPATPAFWADQLVAPVRFSDAAAALFEAHPGCQVLEVGPGETLSGLLRGQPGCRKSGASIRSLLGRTEAGAGEYAAFLAAVGSLWQAGAALDREWFDAQGGRRVPIPTYPFERERHFVDRAPAVAAPPLPAPVAAAAPEPATEVAEGPRLAELTWVRQPAAGGGAPPAPGGAATPVLALLPEDPAARGQLVSVLQRAGFDPLPLDGAGCLDREGMLAAVEGLARGRKLPATVVHGLLYGEPGGDDPIGSTATLFWLAQAMQRHRAQGGLEGWRLVVVTQRAVDVTGGEALAPDRWMAAGFLATLAQEVTSVRCHLVDAGRRVGLDRLAAQLAALDRPVVALRGGDVWLPAVRPFQPSPRRRPRLRRRGTYLVTGGLGDLGLAAARTLAGTGLQPRLGLVGRAGLPEPDEDPRGVRAAIAGVESLGAEVEVVAADVAVEEDVRRALGRLRSRFGELNGVIHAAGVAGDGLIELRGRNEIESVLRPKVLGGPLLHRLLAGEPALDFIVHYSSVAAVHGLVGSADYSAANGYLDALARQHGGGDLHVVSLNWPSWAEVGMAARSGREAAPAPAPAQTERDGGLVVDRTFTGEEWFLDGHRIAGRPVLPGTAFVDLVLTAARDAGVAAADQAVVLRDLVFLVPLAVPRPTVVRVELRPVQRFHMVAVRSRPEGSNTWTDHAQAVLVVGGEEPGDVDLAAVYRQLGQGEPLEPSVRGSGLVQFGREWDNVERAARTDGVIVAELRLPEPFRDEGAGHLAHPALLDNATAVIHQGVDRPHLPFLYREAAFFRPVPEALVTVATVRGPQADALSADIDLYDLRGRQVARVRGFTMRAVDPAAVGRSLEGDPAAEAPERAERPAASGWLSPADGARVLLQAIECDLPTNVLVRAPGASPAIPGYVDLGAPAVTAVAEPAPAPAPAPAPPPLAAASRPPAPDAAPETLESQVGALFVEVLGDQKIGADDDFFALGGTSLAGVQLVTRIRDTFGIELSIGILFEMGTVRQLAAELGRLRV